MAIRIRFTLSIRTEKRVVTNHLPQGIDFPIHLDQPCPHLVVVITLVLRHSPPPSGGGGYAPSASGDVQKILLFLNAFR